VADITDKAHFTPERVASWGRLVVLVASIVCKSLSPIGKREGLAKIGAYLRGLWRIIKLSEPEIFVSECVPGLEKDPLFKKKVLGPLRKLGYGCSYECIDARAYTSCARNRIFLVCFRDPAAQARFAFPAPPDKRIVHLYPLLLPAYSKSAPAGTRQAPLASYCATRAIVAMKSRVKREAAEKQAAAAAAAAAAVAAATVTAAAVAAAAAAPAAAAAAAAAAASAPAKKAARPPRVRQADWSIAGRAVKELSFLRGLSHSSVVNFQYGRVNASRTGRAMAPTLVWSPSGGYMVNDAHGPRMLVASEVAPLFGFSVAEAEAAEAAVGGSSTKVVSALGDSIVVYVLRDVLRAALRARGPPTQPPRSGGGSE
jgi:site-specific DNA-cytosine methylase